MRFAVICGHILASLRFHALKCAVIIFAISKATYNSLLAAPYSTYDQYKMNNYSCLPPPLANKLDEFVRHTITRAGMHSRRPERDTLPLTDEQTHLPLDAYQLCFVIPAVVDDAISSTLHGRTGRNTYPLPNNLPPAILCGIWSCLEFRDLFAVTGVCQSWRTIGLAATTVKEDTNPVEITYIRFRCLWREVVAVNSI